MKQVAGIEKKINLWVSVASSDDWIDDFQSFDDMQECVAYVERVYPGQRHPSLVKLDVNGYRVELKGKAFCYHDDSLINEESIDATFSQLRQIERSQEVERTREAEC